MKTPKRILIIGHMGAGKSLLAQALAEKLKYKFIDIYLGLESLERSIGKSLAEILDQKSLENIFQHQENLLKFYLKQENLVITTDYSVILSPKIRELLDSEYVIYLKVDIETQLIRMENSLLQTFPLLSAAEQEIFLNKLHHERDFLFEKLSSLTINSVDVETDVNNILKNFE